MNLSDPNIVLALQIGQMVIQQANMAARIQQLEAELGQSASPQPAPSPAPSE